jgi:flagellar secretion chaperone FliS
MNDMLDAYRQNSVANAEYADPHQLISMLFDGAMERLSRAIGHMERGETAAKGECLSRAVSIINMLQVSLDHEQGGDLAERLDSLYDYMMRRVTEANLHNDAEKLREVQQLIEPVRDAWKEIGSQLSEQSGTATAAGVS